MNIDEKELEKNAILKALDWVNHHKPNLYCGSQCIEFDKTVCNKCIEKYKKDLIKWENKLKEKGRKYYESRI